MKSITSVYYCSSRPALTYFGSCSGCHATMRKRWRSGTTASTCLWSVSAYLRLHSKSSFSSFYSSPKLGIVLTLETLTSRGTWMRERLVTFQISSSNNSNNSNNNNANSFNMESHRCRIWVFNDKNKSFVCAACSFINPRFLDFYQAIRKRIYQFLLFYFQIFNS